MNPLLDQQIEEKCDAMIAELDRAGYLWDGCLPVASDGYKFHGLRNLPFYLQVYRVWDYYQWRKKLNG